jgi:hypothetical protein
MTQQSRHSRDAVLAAVVFTALLAVLGFKALDPEALFSIDAGIKLLQAEALRDSGLSSLAIPYPAEAIDPRHEYTPFMLPFVFERHGTFHGMYPLAVAGAYAAALFAGLPGTVLISVLSALLVMLAMVRVSGRWALKTIVVLVACTPFWAYGVLMWEHMPALAFSTWAWAWLLAPSRKGPAVAGLMFGIATALRPETVLIVPGMALLFWRRLEIRGLWQLGLAFMLPLVAIGVIDAAAYGRTPFVHVVHAVDVAWRAVGASAPVARPQEISIWDQAKIVSGDWVVGIPGVLPGICLGGLLLAAHWGRRRMGDLGVIVVLTVATALVFRDVVVTWKTPELVAGLFRGSPCLLLALLPMASAPSLDRERRMELVVVALYVAGLFVTRQYGGVQIGPRFLVPLLPLLAKMTVDGLESYRNGVGPQATHALVVGLSIATLAGSAALQLIANVRTVGIVNEEGSQLLQFVRSSRAPVVVISDLFLINHVAPEYGKIWVLRALNDSEAKGLARRLAERGISPVVTIDRIAPGTFRASLPDFQAQRKTDTRHARATLWALKDDPSSGRDQLSPPSSVVP